MWEQVCVCGLVTEQGAGVCVNMWAPRAWVDVLIRSSKWNCMGSQLSRS